MKITAISDIHGMLPLPIKEEEVSPFPRIYPTDILCIAGDICPNKYGVRDKFFDAQYQHNWLLDTFNPWLESLPAKWIIVVAGNHDFCFEHYKGCNFPWPKNVRYLQNSSTEVDGVKLYGNPYSLWFYNWAFNTPEENGDSYLSAMYQSIPDDTNIIVTHQPVSGYGDLPPRTTRPAGSKALLDRVNELEDLKAVIYGHIHCGYGQYKHNDVTLVNACLCDEKYRPVNPIITIEI
jgi:Icc-related predicted phosphoesterase